MDRAEAIRVLTVERSSHSNGGLVEQAIDVALDALREQEQREWISVSERLPKSFVSVLGYCPDEEPLPTVHECYVNGFGQWTSSVVYGMGTVTHWMPLPEPPDEQK